MLAHISSAFARRRPWRTTPRMLWVHYSAAMVVFRMFCGCTFGGQPVLEVREGSESGPLISADAVAESGRDFGERAIGEVDLAAPLTIVVRNTGWGPLAFGAPIINGGDAGDFHLVMTNSPSELEAGGAAAVFFVNFTPTGEGDKSTTVSFSHDAPDVPSPFIFALHGVGTTPGALGAAVKVYEGSRKGAAISPGDAAAGGRLFGDVAVGGNDAPLLAIVVVNSGSEPLMLTDATLSGNDAADFVLFTQGAPTQVMPSNDTVWLVGFRPLSPGAKSAWVSFAHDAPAPAVTPYTFEVSGIGTGLDVGAGPPISISTSSDFVIERSGTALFEVRLGAPSVQAVAVDYATTADTATSGLDFMETRGTLVFPVGSEARSISVPLISDALSEASELFTVELSNAVGGSIVVPSAAVTILDDDPLPELSVGSASASEGDASDAMLDFEVTLSPASGQSVSVDYATRDDTATVANNDYISVTGSLVFAPGETTKKVSVAIVADLTPEPSERFAFALSNAANGLMRSATGYGTILSDDGLAYAWGSAALGHLGDNTQTLALVPQLVQGLDNVTHVASGFNHTIILRQGEVWAFGQNTYGQLGDGTMTSRPAPVRVLGPFGVGTMDNAVAIAAGYNQSFVLRADGYLYSFGHNNACQLGDGTFSSIMVPQPVLGLNGSGYLTGVTMVATDLNHTLAIKSDGTLWAFGSNSAGMLGQGNTTISCTPVQVKSADGVTPLSNVIAIAVGQLHSLAVTDNNTAVHLYAWGSNANGQLGDGTLTTRLLPTDVADLASPNKNAKPYVTAVSAGSQHSLALLSTGQLRSFGANASSQLGDGTTNLHTSPVAVEVTIGGLTGPLTGVTGIGCGLTHCFALTAGDVYGWGLNSNAQLGVNSLTTMARATRVFGLGGNISLGSALAAAAGQLHSVVLLADATVVSFGSNIEAQLGNGSCGFRTAPQLIRNTDDSGSLSRVSMVSAGVDHNLALDADGIVWAWGSNGDGRVGDNTAEMRLLPVKARLLKTGEALGGISSVAAGRAHSLAVSAGGQVFAWGSNGNGRLGDGSTTARVAAVPVVAGPGFLADVIKVAAGNVHSLALRSDGAVFAWGGGAFGVLGQGSASDSPVPLQVVGVGGAPYLTDISAISTRYRHNLALRNDGTVWAWGDSGYGQIGDGTTQLRLAPVQVVGLSDVTAIAAGQGFSLALKRDGTVWAWGYNTYGNLGDDSTATRLTPVQVHSATGGYLTGVATIAAGDTFAFAIMADGSVWAWGNNNYGQLGDGTRINRTAPRRVQSPDTLGFFGNVQAISAGSTHSLALQ